MMDPKIGQPEMYDIPTSMDDAMADEFEDWMRQKQRTAAVTHIQQAEEAIRRANAGQSPVGDEDYGAQSSLYRQHVAALRSLVDDGVTPGDAYKARFEPEADEDVETEERRPTEAVNHPAHYEALRIEPLEVINAWELCSHLSNVIKYVGRCDHKGTPILDLEKAHFYLEFELEKRKAAVYGRFLTLKEFKSKRTYEPFQSPMPASLNEEGDMK